MKILTLAGNRGLNKVTYSFFRQYNMIKTKIAHPNESTRKQFAYFPYLGVYPNTSDMNESGEMLKLAKR